MNRIYRKFALLATVLSLGAGGVSAEELLVGAELPLTGPLARVGNGMGEGISVAVEMFNKANGKHTVKLVTVDDESNPAKAVAAVEKLEGQGVLAITGGFGSSIVGPASDAANKLGLVYMTAGGTDDNLTARGLKTFFRINNNAAYENAALGLLDEMKVKSVSVIYVTRESTTNVAKSVQESLGAKGVAVSMHPYDPAITDFKPIINKVRLRDKPEAVLMVGYDNDYVGILRAAKVLKPDVKAMVGLWSLATPKMAADFPDLMPSVYGAAPLPYPVEFRSEEGQRFAETYKNLFNKEPDYLGQFGYVQAMVLFEAIARAADKGTLKQGGVVTELRETNRDTMLGRVQFDDKGDIVNFTHRMAQHQDGKIVIVWPSDEATGKMSFPGVPW